MFHSSLLTFLNSKTQNLKKPNLSNLQWRVLKNPTCRKDLSPWKHKSTYKWQYVKQVALIERSSALGTSRSPPQHTELHLAPFLFSLKLYSHHWKSPATRIGLVLNHSVSRTHTSHFTVPCCAWPAELVLLWLVLLSNWPMWVELRWSWTRMPLPQSGSA